MTKKSILCLSFAFCMVLSGAASAGIYSVVSSTIHHFAKDVDIGIYIRSLNTGAVLYSKNSERMFMPASTLKTFTAASALDYLGPDYVFQTQILSSTNRLLNGILQGDVYLYFDGDPSLTRGDLNQMLQTLAARGVTTIAGNLYIDDTIFDHKSYGPGWMWDEKNFCYAAPTDAIMLNKNCFPFKVVPAKQSGQPAAIVSYPQYNFMSIVSSVMSKRAIDDECPLSLKVSDNNSYYLSGCVRPRSAARNLLVGIKNIRLFTQGVVADLLAKNRIKLTGKIEFAKSQVTKNFEHSGDHADYFVLINHKSAPLRVLVKTMLKHSDNLYADALYKKLGYSYWHKTATWKNSSAAVRRILARKCPAINFRHLHIVDGSGLSRYNLVNPKQLGQLLTCVYHNSKIRNAFYAALPIGGIDGSLQYRFRDISVRARVHAKTGTMKNISSLAGYLHTHNGHVLVFAIMINDFWGKLYRFHALQDAICKFLVLSY